MEKMLIVADLGDSDIAIARGLALAARLGQEVDVVAFTHAPLAAIERSESGRESLRQRLLVQREIVVRSRIDDLSHPGQSVGLDVVWEKDIHHWLTARCVGGGYSMVVKTGNRTESLVHTSTDWQLLRECPAPVLLVAKKKWHRVRPVLAALDLASARPGKRALNRKVLAAARTLAQALAVELEIISAIEVPKVLAELDMVDASTWVRNARAGMQPRIAELAAEFALPVSAFRYKRGTVEKVITSRAAKVRAQLVVMGTVGRKGVRGRVIGNTAEKVLQHMHTDVLAIKP